MIKPVCIGLLLLAAVAAAQRSAPYNPDAERDKTFWNERREWERKEKQYLDDYRASLRQQWNAQARAQRITSQQARLMEINAQIQRTGEARASELIEVGMDLLLGDGVRIFPAARAMMDEIVAAMGK